LKANIKAIRLCSFPCIRNTRTLLRIMLRLE